MITDQCLSSLTDQAANIPQINQIFKEKHFITDPSFIAGILTILFKTKRRAGCCLLENKKSTNSLLNSIKQMKTIKILFTILSAAAFLAACDNTGNNRQRDTDTPYRDTTYMEPAPPANDTLMNDTL